MTANKKHLAWLAATIFALCSSAVFLAAQSNGTCFAPNDRLSDAQKVELAVSAVLSTYPPEVVKKVWIERSGKRVLEETEAGTDPRSFSLHQPTKPIFYNGARDFIDKNPNCCSVVSMRSSEEGSPSKLSKLLGGEASYVMVTYRVGYLDELDNITEVKYREFIGITNCGRPVRSAGTVQ